jgi:hypothetical protein
LGDGTRVSVLLVNEASEGSAVGVRRMRSIVGVEDGLHDGFPEGRVVGCCDGDIEGCGDG